MSMFFVPGGDPNEFARQRELHEMEHEAFAHDVKALFGEMEPENLATLGKILDLIARHNDAPIASYYHGIAEAVLTYVHDRCTCGKDHTEEMPTPETEPPNEDPSS